MKIGIHDVGTGQYFWCESNHPNYKTVWFKDNEVFLMLDGLVIHQFKLSSKIEQELSLLRASKQLGLLSVRLRELARNDYALFFRWNTEAT